MNAPGLTSITISEIQLHELRNRLTVVKGTAQLLNRHAHRDDEPQLAPRTEALLKEIQALEVAVQRLTVTRSPVPADPSGQDGAPGVADGT